MYRGKKSFLPIEGLCVKDNLYFKEFLFKILDMQVKNLRNKDVVSVKVLWKNHLVECATWEVKADTKSRYPHIFNNYG